MDFRIEADFWALFPAAHIEVLIARGIDNEVAGEKAEEAEEAATLLAQAAEQMGMVLAFHHRLRSDPEPKLPVALPLQHLCRLLAAYDLITNLRIKVYGLALCYNDISNLFHNATLPEALGNAC
ncbi:MAG: hypothetical protein M3441_18410 [Chloroflexota bacterium]|nr:hypothetical protein [Chloroflexota bacterium]